jgi:hypothetical protein
VTDAGGVARVESSRSATLSAPCRLRRRPTNQRVADDAAGGTLITVTAARDCHFLPHRGGRVR